MAAGTQHLPELKVEAVNPQLLLDSLISVSEVRRERLKSRSPALYNNSSLAEHANVLPDPGQPTRLKVLCIRLMELLGPQLAQLDAIEQCLYALSRVVPAEDHEKLKQLSIEDMLNFILTDEGSVPAAQQEHD